MGETMIDVLSLNDEFSQSKAGWHFL